MSNQNLYFFTFNNYQNKLCKGRPNLQTAKHIIKASFNPNDGVDATQVVNVQYDLYDCDYMVEEYAQNQYRCWYIVDVTRLSGGQIQINLKRDILTDYLDEVYNMKLVIHRGYVPNDNSAIYNQEGFNFNQIKTRETLLKDKTNCAWIVGYVPLGLNLSSIEFATPELANIETISSINNLPYLTSVDNDVYVYNSHNIFTYIKTLTNNLKIFLFSGFSNTKYKDEQIPTTSNEFIATSGFLTLDYDGISKRLTDGTASENDTWYERFYDYAKGSDTHSIKSSELIENENGKIYFSTSDNKYYKIVITKLPNTKKFSKDIIGTSLASYIYSKCESLGFQPHVGYSQSKRIGNGELVVDVYRVFKQEITQNGQYHIYPTSFTNDNIKVNNQPYKMFAFPYLKDDDRLLLSDSSAMIQNKMEIVNAFLSYWTKDNGRILDLQIVPYCPNQKQVISVLGVNAIQIDDSLKIDILDTNNRVVSRGFWVTNDSQSFNVDNIVNIENAKLELECDLYRLCSPHYETAFEFNAVKMGGWNSIKVDMTLKPYAPYVHLIPNYQINSLYGVEAFSDARGLVSSCSYSLPLASEEWATYQRTNSIYELSFNRDIQNLEFQQNVARVRELIGIGAGAMGGAMATAQSPDPVSKAIGVASGVAMGTVNMAISEQLRKESMQYSLDKYNLNLKNIKAQPQTLTKVTALDINNRLFPVLEYYTCTEEEKLFFKDYLLYNGYRVERIGCIKDYVDRNADFTFIQADFIRLESVLGLDSHELGYISECISAGWYFKPIEED